VDAGPFSVFLNDGVAVLLAAGAVARLVQLRRPSWSQLWIAGLGLLVLALTLRGGAELGVQAAVNEARKYLYFLSAAAYFSTVPPRRVLFDRLGVYWLLAAGALVVLAVVRWAALAVGVSGGVLGEGTSLRVLSSAPTLLIAQACFIGLASWARSRGLLTRAGVACSALTVLFLQHRTVWVVLVIGGAVLLTRDRGLRRGVVLLVGVLVAGLSVAAFTVLEAPDNRVSAGLERSATNSDTFEWRYEGWRELVEAGPSEYDEILFGLPFGSGYARQVGQDTVEVSPHNFYLETYLRLGVVGLLGIFGLLARLLWLLRRAVGGPGLLDDHVLFVLLVSACVYNLTYAPALFDGLLLGLAASAAARRRAHVAAVGEQAAPVPALARAGR
jgi:O-antigen ligase